ncbi:hypothetical protein BFG52_00730 [Acinetobacter larvae]|uniref:DUF3325 domain-containing protein n=1 Tax=Acinetobacter larvae TaxID=1789224 RepID=A0A1B2LVS7_9GAMM|nr:hypothetical protein BFG52_00730 [Acinetobacter larvae]
MKLVAMMLCIATCFILYLTHPNQTVLTQALSKRWRIPVCILLLLSAVWLFYLLPALVACFMVVLSMMMVWTFAPFISIFKKYFPHESQATQKNSS